MLRSLCSVALRATSCSSSIASITRCLTSAPALRRARCTYLYAEPLIFSMIDSGDRNRNTNVKYGSSISRQTVTSKSVMPNAAPGRCAVSPVTRLTPTHTHCSVVTTNSDIAAMLIGSVTNNQVMR